jgi:outer membrane protein assembly factor BamD (BamD/ComL family)
MGNLQVHPTSESETDPAAPSPFLGSIVTRVAVYHLLLWASLTLQVGCASFNLFKKEDDEYIRARNSIEGYEDKEGNWIRPEGSRADKIRDSNLPKALHWIPGLGPKIVNKDLARSLKKEADDEWNSAVALEGEERRKALRSAAKKYLAASKNWASSALEQDCLWQTAECYYYAEDYYKAENYYAKLLKEYPRNRYQDRLDQRRMEIGQFWLKFKDEFYHINLTDNKRPWNDTRKHGVRVLEKMRLDNPTGRLADDVTMELANTAFQKENWHDALDTYGDLISTYPDSPHQFEAHMLGIKAALMSYNGPEYSDDSLEKAEKMIKQIVRQFRSEAEKEREKIQDAFNEVRYRRAERIYTLANYRFNRSEAKAARIECTKILEEYGDTPFAEKARQIMEKTGGMPDEPVQQMKWLSDLFPSRDKITPLLKPLPEVEDNSVQRDVYERTASQDTTNPPDVFESAGNKVRR